MDERLREKVDPKLYGLTPRTVLIQKGPGKFTLVIKRKSRIIMKDALLILKKADTIKDKVPDASISLKTTAPICSKSIQFLNDNDIALEDWDF